MAMSLDASRKRVITLVYVGAATWTDISGNLPDELIVAETVATGYTFQGRLLRPVVVRLREKSAPAPEEVREAGPAEAGEQQDQLTLGTAD